MSVFVRRPGEEGLEKRGLEKRGSGAACQKLFSYRGLDVRAVRRCAGDRRSSLNRCLDGAPNGCPKYDPGGVHG